MTPEQELPRILWEAYCRRNKWFAEAGHQCRSCGGEIGFRLEGSADPCLEVVEVATKCLACDGPGPTLSIDNQEWHCSQRKAPVVAAELRARDRAEEAMRCIIEATP